MSLHYLSDASIAAIAEGKPGDIAKIKAGIEAMVTYVRAGLRAYRQGQAFGLDGW